jgi:hypothetical protein
MKPTLRDGFRAAKTDARHVTAVTSDDHQFEEFS